MAENDDLKKLIIGRQRALEQERALWETRYQEVADYVTPHRSDISGTEQPGSKKGTKIYDGTAVGAAILATDGIHGYHVSPAFPWFRYVMSNKALDDIPAVREWLEDSVAHGMYAALNRSNFYSEMWSQIYDGFTIGTASLYCEEDIGYSKIIFDACHPGEIYVAENKYGEVDIVHRKRKMTARNIIAMFGEDALPEAMVSQAKSNPFTEFEVIHCVYPRDEYDTRKKDAKNKKYASVWYLNSTDGKILRESGYSYFPYPTWRYLRSGKSPYGLSPAILAMSDIQGINVMSKSLLGFAQMAVDPPLNIPSELRGMVQWHPRGRNYYDQEKRVITPAQIGGNFPVAIDREQAKQNAIRERFHVDTFLMLASLEGRGQRTAYEVSEMMGEKAAILGAELGPLNNQLDRILDIVYEIETAAGRIDPPPMELLERATETDRFDPEYIGPLAQAQRQKFGTQGIFQGLSAVGQLVTLFPEAADNVDPDETAKQLLKATGFPQKCIRKKDTVEALRKARQQVAAQEAQKQAMLDMAAGAKDMASADANLGGPMAGMLKGALSATGEQVPAVEPA